MKHVLALSDVVKSLHTSQVDIRPDLIRFIAGLTLALCSPVPFFYTWVDTGTVRVTCLAREHNTMSPARARTRTARSEVKSTYHEATAPSMSTKLVY